MARAPQRVRGVRYSGCDSEHIIYQALPGGNPTSRLITFGENDTSGSLPGIPAANVRSSGLRGVTKSTSARTAEYLCAQRLCSDRSTDEQGSIEQDRGVCVFAMFSAVV